MALTTKRIIALPSQTDPQEGDYLAIDNATSGTHKIPVGRIGVEVDDTLTEAGKAADAKAVGNALDEIRSQIEVTGTASGAIATFTDGAEMPAKSVIVNIEPQQSGTGTPSPDNVRPISGWESVSVTDAGVNVWDEEWELGQLKPADGTPSASSNRMRTKNFIPCLSSTNYYICNTTTYTSYFYVFFYDETQTFISYDAIRGDRVFQTPQNCKYVKFFLDDAWGGQTYTGGISINYPSTDHDYHAYNGTTTPVNLGRTVYGGTLDVVSGSLTVDMKYDQMTYSYLSGLGSGYIGFSANVTQVGGNAVWVRNWNYTDYPDNIDGGIKAVCNAFPISMHNKNIINSQYRTWFGVGSMTSVAEFLSAVQTLEANGNGLWIAHELAIPQTYQLTPTEVNTLLGENNVWADSGDVEVVYIRDLNIAINNLLNNNGTRSLGMMAMSAPTEGTAEEPTDEPAEDDMR